MAASGRYKSRLLNYLVEQSQKLSQQASHRLRQARTGVVWGAQVLIYPLYVAFQSSRVVGRRLSQGGAMPGQARLTPPRADDVVSAVLKLARNLADEGAITIGSELSQVEQKQLQTVGAIARQASGGIAGKMPAPASVSPPQEISLEAFAPQTAISDRGANVAIAPSPTQAPLKSTSSNEANLLLVGVDVRGVASELGNRALVLVDNSNRTVPLEAEQQWSLQQAIVQQVADFNYRRQRYSQQLALVEAGDHPLPLPQPRTKQLAGFRWMAHLMGWMQTSDLAQSTNLFKESQLANQLAAQVAAPPFLYWDPEPGQRLTRQTLAQLDSSLVGLEQRYIQRHDRDDAATKALRFTAKLFGLEEAADQWLRASAASKAADQGHAPQQANDYANGLPLELRAGQIPGQTLGEIPGQIPRGSIPGPRPASLTGADPWGNYIGQLPGQAPHDFESLQAPAEQTPSPSQSNLPPAIAQPPRPNPQGWFSRFLNPGSVGTSGTKNSTAVNPPSPGDVLPRGWQRLTTRFGGLLRNLKQPAGSIAPLKPQGSNSFAPPAVAPTNENIGLGPDVGNNHSAPPEASQNNAALQENLAQAGLSDPHIAAAWQKRVANAKTGGLKSKNVTLRTQADGAQAVASASGAQSTGKSSESADPNVLQTAENSVTYESPYIETTAQFNGYERHPLEVILDRLDQILLWIEELGLRLWRWLTNTGEQ